VAQLFAALRRHPDVEAPNLVAVDATDRLLLDEAARTLTALGAGELVVVHDAYGALTLGAALRFGLRGIRTHSDRLTGELALAANAERLGLAGTFASLPLDEDLFAGARAVLVQAPKSLAELAELIQLVARAADSSVVLFVGGRVKHLTHAMNPLLQAAFAEVSAGLARQKSRVLVARGLRAERPAVTFPIVAELGELGVVVAAHGGAFGGATLDQGTRALLRHRDAMAPDAHTAIDLGCGTGLLAVELARARPTLRVLATDESAAAVASARQTAALNGVADRIEVVRDDALSSVATASVDLIVCNPPFHLGTAVHTGAASKMFAAAGRVLRPGGQLWTVFNSGLAYQAELTRRVGPTRVAGRDPKFTVTASTRR
jgi:16S rRNA (guanine1207-N2)-methyltransferase